MRGWIADRGNYSAPVAIGSVMRALAVGEIVELRHPDYRAGEIVTGWFGWQELATVDGERRRPARRRNRSPAFARPRRARHQRRDGADRPHRDRRAEAGRDGSRVDRGRARSAPRSARSRRSSAAGPSGSPAGRRKVAQCLEVFGYDAAIDYKAPGSARRSTKPAPTASTSISTTRRASSATRCYPRLAVGARVVICGTASISSWDPWPAGPRIERHLLVKRARAQGFVVMDYMDRWEASVATLADWVRAGKLRYEEDILYGLEACPDALAGLYRGENRGKRLIRI